MVVEDLYVLELGLRVTVEVRCIEPTAADVVDGLIEEPSTLGPCGIVNGRTRVHHLLDELQIAEDLEAEIQSRLEREVRERIEHRIRGNISNRIRGQRDALEPR